MNSPTRDGFWRQALAWHGSVSPRIILLVLGWGVIAGAVCLGAILAEWHFGIYIGLAVAPYEFAGTALAILLVLRTNAGYDRWWEARKLWGGIVNQSRNLAISALSYGPRDAGWRKRFVGWVAAFPHLTRACLRGQPAPPEVGKLVDEAEFKKLAAADHLPGFAARSLAGLLHEACAQQQLDRFAFLQIDRERALLIDHIGACERILKTPLAKVFAIKVRRFIAIFLLTLPLALLHKLDAMVLIPIITMLVAYPLHSLDEIAVELQNPFPTTNLSHLPLDDICATIERNVLALLDQEDSP
ncbi:MAG: bestrophin family protein [Gemmataceae bacterium]